MYLLIDNKLYCKDGDVYKSVDIINNQTIFNNIEEKKTSENGLLLTYEEVYAKFGINMTNPQLSRNYNFPIGPNPKTTEPTEPTETSNGKPKSKTSNK